MEEVSVIVNVPKGTTSKQVKVDIRVKSLKVVVNGQTVIEGKLTGSIHQDDSIWTLVDKEKIEICLLKTDKEAKNTWMSLLEGQYEANPYIFDEMEKKMSLERFQKENPGMDFSGATITGNYHGGGPAMPGN